ncbi:MAG: glucosidase [Rubrivivax sp.]
MKDDPEAWRRYGPYLSERQWGTVREDYSADGNAWAYLPHDQARSRAYRWGEDGIGGFSDDRQLLCLSVAMWNGRDPIMKERLFGLTNDEGNHGEDVKELYYHLDAVPSHAYMAMRYKYPQAAFPYQRLLDGNRDRGLDDAEFELIDTGVFDDDRYFDILIEYAKATPDHVVLRITATNRGPDTATLHLLPQLFARNTWSWKPGIKRPALQVVAADRVKVDHPLLPKLQWRSESEPGQASPPQWLLCDNDTNRRRFGEPDASGCFKDGIGDWLVGGDARAAWVCAPGGEGTPGSGTEGMAQPTGTKIAALHRFELAPGASQVVSLHLEPRDPREGKSAPAAQSAAQIVARRRAEADAWYAVLQRGIVSADHRLVQRQALAGLLWSKQFYAYDVRDWLAGDPLQPPPPPERRNGRNVDWGHLSSGDILAMPDTWEYPWFAAWDLAFHCVTHALVDPAFAKAQLVLLTQSRFMHPSGQLPAYEWAFGDANPPVHGWAALQIYEMDRQRTGVGDTLFLESMFHKLMLNFTWWVNRKDADGRNLFQGGFLGLDNIGPYDRNQPLPGGGWIDQSDGTAWVAAYALNLMRMALELAMSRPVYEDLATKFVEHFLYIAEAVHATCGSAATGLWDDTDGFYYDVLRQPDGSSEPLRVRSVVGLIPLLAVEVLHGDVVGAQRGFEQRLHWFFHHRPDLAALVSHFTDPNRESYRLLALMRRDRLKRVLLRMLDENEFLSPHGIRALSKVHETHPVCFDHGGHAAEVRYTPAESRTRDFGGNSNWRGPVWFPVNLLIIQALRKYQTFYGDDFKVEFPSRSGRLLCLREIADALSERLIGLFAVGTDGRRPFLGESPKEQSDPHFRDLLQFHEYFDGDNGRGCGAAHQSGWTAAVALLLQPGTQATAQAAAHAAAATHSDDRTDPAEAEPTMPPVPEPPAA